MGIIREVCDEYPYVPYIAGSLLVGGLIYWALSSFDEKKPYFNLPQEKSTEKKQETGGRRYTEEEYQAVLSEILKRMQTGNK